MDLNQNMVRLKKTNLFCNDSIDGCLLYNSVSGDIYAIKNYNSKSLENNEICLTNQEDITLYNEIIAQKRTEISSPNLSQPVDFEQLYLIITEKCNLKCKYCRQISSSNSRTMDESEIISAIELFLNLSKKPQSLVLYGGEVLLYSDLTIMAIDFIRTKVPQIPVTIITNGIFVDEKIAFELYKRNVFVVFSIDGPKDYHDAARVTYDGRSSYLDAIKGYYNYQKVGGKVGISCTIGPHTANNLEEIKNWIVRLNPLSVGFGLPHGDLNNYAFQIENFKALYRKIFQISDELGQQGISVVHVERKMRDYFLNNLNLFECHACSKRLVICPGYNYGICEGAVTDKKYFYTDIQSAREKALEWQSVSPYRNAKCDGCISRRVCGGGCPYDKMLRFGNIECLDESKCLFQKMLADFVFKKATHILLPFIPNGRYIIKVDDQMRKKLVSEVVMSKTSNIPLLFNSNVAIN